MTPGVRDDDRGATDMGNFDFEAGKRLRDEGEIVDALRCFKSAVEQDRDFVEAYIELAVTYLLAFEESGDPLCLDSSRNVCVTALRRDPEESQRRRLIDIQTKVEDLLLESQKAEMDAMTDAMADSEMAPAPLAGPGLDPDLAEELERFVEDPGDGDLGH